MAALSRAQRELIVDGLRRGLRPRAIAARVGCCVSVVHTLAREARDGNLARWLALAPCQNVDRPGYDALPRRRLEVACWWAPGRAVVCEGE